MKSESRVSEKGAINLNWNTLVTTSPALILAIPLLFSFLIMLLGKFFKRSTQILFPLALILTSFFVGTMAIEVLTAESWMYVFGAEQPYPENGTSFFRIVFMADGFSVLATMTTATIAVVAGIYSYGYMKRESGLEKYYTLFLLTWVGINGMVLTNDLFNMFVWFEVTTIASCGLIAFQKYRLKSVEASLKYLLLSVAAGLFFLFSIGLLYGQHGVLNLHLLSGEMTGSFNDRLAVGLILVVFAMKSSSVPFHLWTPDVYGESPGSVSPFMAITSMGFLFALFRLLLNGFIGGISPEVVGLVLMVLGILSMLVGVMMALAHDDLRRLLAYLSISQIGYIMLVIGVGITTLDTGRYDEFGSLAFTGGLFHMINDAIYKALLFLSIITVVHVTGIRDKNQLSGIFHKMPYTSFFFLIGALSIAGVPPFSGFYSKFLIYQATFLYHPLLGLFAAVVSIFILVVMVKLFSNIFLGPKKEEESKVKIPKTMFVGMTLLAILVAVFSIIPHVVVSEIIVPAVEALVG